MAATARDVEGERARPVAPRARQCFIREQGAQLVEGFDIRHRIGARRAPDGRLVDQDDVLEVLPPLECRDVSDGLAEMLFGAVLAAQPSLELPVQHVMDERRFPGARYSGHRRECPEAGKRACFAHGRRRSLVHDLPTGLAAPWAELDHPAGGAHRGGIVFDDDHGVAGVGKASQ